MCIGEKGRECVREQVGKAFKHYFFQMSETGSKEPLTISPLLCLSRTVLPAKTGYLCVSSFTLPFLLVHVAKQSEEIPTAFPCIPIPL